MSISTYSELVTAVTGFLHNSAAAGMAPTLIALAEAKFNRELRVEDMVEEYTGSITASEISLPADFLEAISLSVGDDPFEFKPRTVFFTLDGNFYTRRGDQLILAKNITGATDVSLIYYARIPALTEAAPTNWLLTAAPDLYLYGTLIEAVPYMRLGADDTRPQIWASGMSAALGSIQGSDDASRFSGQALTISNPR